ncbi:MAG: thiamine pyrophosphate-dependent enzyme [Chloroflexota bacterium]
MIEDIPHKEIALQTDEILKDYRLAVRSREMSLNTRREVLNGRAKFGAGGGGKELAGLAIARQFQPGDWRSGYYRDQTMMLALGLLSARSFFAQVYAHASLEHEPTGSGRLMVTHFGSRSLNTDGSWKDLSQSYNSAPDISCTAGQMPRLVGLAYASKLYRHIDELSHLTTFSNKGNEVAFGTIGNGSSAEGHFWEAVNAIGVLASPAVLSIFDDGYGISVPNKYQMTKEDIGALLSGFQREGDGPGYDVYTVRGWDYPALIEVYETATRNARESHVPALIHVTEMMQPQGHSTSGSHERYKPAERMQWEKDHDPLLKMRQWLVSEGISDEATLDVIAAEEKQFVLNEVQAAFDAMCADIDGDREKVAGLIDQLVADVPAQGSELTAIKQGMYTMKYPRRSDLMIAAHKSLLATRKQSPPSRNTLANWRKQARENWQPLFSDQMHDPVGISSKSVQPVYSATAEEVPGFTILNKFFDAAFAREPRLITFGEDTGFIGGVNQSLAGLQAKYGELRITDTGIREMTILGQAIGLALRGLRPIAEMQYLDYLMYALQTMSDDLATMRWRSRGGHQAPVIVRTRGHRLEGVWHSGSLMGGIIHNVRGMHVCVPRDMTRAAGFYNTLLAQNDPALVVEVLLGYRQKEKLPDNLAEISIPLGVPETLRPGSHVTLVTYGALCKISMEAAERLAQVGIEAEVIDVQTLLPFDVNHTIVESLKRTNHLLVVDEDVPGGASAFIMQKILEEQGGYHWLDGEPKTLTATEHRPPFGTDGNYFSKPNVEDIFDAVYAIMHDSNPAQYPEIF